MREERVVAGLERLRPVLQRIESYREEMIDFQRDLTAVPALGPDNGGQGEQARALFLEERLRTFGLGEIARLDASDPRVESGLRPNLLVRLAGQRQGPAVLVLCHMDTVPPGELGLWQGDPFTLRLEDGRLVGRGAEDNQQGLTSSVFALRALVEEGLRPPTDVRLLLVADEETGNAYGIEHVLDAESGFISGEDLVLVPDFGTPGGADIEVAEKSTVWVELRIRGRQVHASLPDTGVNAHRAAAHLVVWLDERLPARFPEEDARFEPARSTFEPTKRTANVPNVNTIPGEEVLYFDCRVLPRHPLEEVQAVFAEGARWLGERFGVTVEVAYPVFLAAAPSTADDAPIVRALAQALQDVRGAAARTIGIGGATVAAPFRRRGIPAAVWATMDDTAHQPNEYCLLENLIEDAKIFAHLFLQPR